jgi:N-acetylglucosaminyl-diphospho-decaprenol L-rhamnosyltransferase
VPADIAVVIVNYNSAHVVVGLLESLPAALGDIAADVIVVDNGSSDDSIEILESRSDCRLIRSTNTGYSGGLNRGVAANPDAPTILVLNPDARMHPASIAPLMAALAQPGTAVAVPKVLTETGQLYKSLRREPTLLRALGLTATNLAVFSEYVGDPAEYENAHTVDWALGAVMLMTRTAYDALGGWDESFFLYSEETDFCLRARDVGLATRYEPASVAVHIGGGSGQNDRTHSMLIVNRVRLYARRHNSAAAWGYWVLSLLSEFSWLIRGHRNSLASMRSLISKKARPAELRCSEHLLPR